MSTLLDNVLGIKDLSPTQIVAFILGITFTILAVAGVLFAYKFAGKIKSKTKLIFASLVLPFIAIACWLILIFSFVNGFRQDDLMNIFVSLALSLVICFMILMISYVLFQKHKDNLSEEEKLAEEEMEEEQEKEEPVKIIALPEPKKHKANENNEEVETTDEETTEVVERETITETETTIKEINDTDDE